MPLMLVTRRTRTTYFDRSYKRARLVSFLPLYKKREGGEGYWRLLPLKNSMAEMNCSGEPWVEAPAPL